MTVAGVSGEKFWNGKTIVWFMLAIVLAIGMVGVTYYYHLHENDNAEDATPEDTANSKPVSFRRR